MTKQDLGKATLDGTTVFRCMLIGVSDALASVCRRALDPVFPVRVSTPEEACAQMSAIHPLVVVVGPDARVTRELEEIAGACGAETIVVGANPNERILSRQLVDAVRVAESRRTAR